MSFLQKLGLVEEVPDSDPKEKEAPKAPTLQRPLTPMPMGAQTTLPPAFSPHTTAAPDPVVLSKLEALVAQNTPTDHAKFMEQYQKLQKYIPTESDLFKAALEASGGTVDQLSSALDTLIGVMNKAREDFERALDTQKQGLAQMDATIQAKEAQIQTLQQQILATRASRDTASQALDNKQQGFNAAHAQVLGQLTSQKTHVMSQAK